MMKKLFRGKKSKHLWKCINKAKSKKQLRIALYALAGHCQELEHRVEDIDQSLTNALTPPLPPPTPEPPLIPS